MIVAVTKLKGMPKSCSRCKFSETEYVRSIPLGRKCTLAHKFIPTEKSPHGNDRYIKPYWCPLREVSQDSFDK